MGRSPELGVGVSMDSATLSLAIVAGVLATFNPCGFALLPAYMGVIAAVNEGCLRLFLGIPLPHFCDPWSALLGVRGRAIRPDAICRFGHELIAGSGTKVLQNRVQSRRELPPPDG